MKKVLFFNILFIIGYIHVNATTTTWTGGTGDWNVAASWTNGLPGVMDSAIISGLGAQVSIPTGFVANIAYVELSDSAHLLIQNGALLSVSNTMGYSIHLVRVSTITNQSVISVPQSGTRAIQLANSSELINEGVINIDHSFYGIAIMGNSSLSNSGEILIANANFGFTVFSNTMMENNGLFDLTACNYSIDLRQETYFLNQDSVSIKDGLTFALQSYGEVINNGAISISNMQDADYPAIMNDSFSCCDTFYIATTTNNGLIEIMNCEGDGLFCAPSTTFFNFGEMHISNCEQRGIVLEPLARLRVEDGASCTVSSSDAPLDVGDESTFVVRLGGVFDAFSSDASN